MTTMPKPKTPARFVLIDDPNLIQHLHAVRQRREDVSLAKTVKDVIKERLRDLAAGDPLAIRQDGRRVSKAS